VEMHSLLYTFYFANLGAFIGRTNSKFLDVLLEVIMLITNLVKLIERSV